MTTDTAIAIVVSGLVSGSIYALMAAGLSLVWGTLRVFNFAHGAFLMLGAYAAWSYNNWLGGPLIIALVLGVVTLIAVGGVAERVVVRPFITKPGGDLLVMIATLAAASIFENGALLHWGAELKQLPTVSNRTLILANSAVGANQIAIVILSPLLLLLAAGALKFTKMGLAIRAVEQNRDFSRLVGVDTGRVYSVTFGASAGLAAVAGVLLGGIFFITPAMGDAPLLKAFIVVVFGGLGSLGGTIAGAYVIGMIESLSVYYLGLYWTPVVLFSVMLVVMLIRPSGLFGRKGH